MSLFANYSKPVLSIVPVGKSFFEREGSPLSYYREWDNEETRIRRFGE